jgi:hypothetical protein
MRYCFATLAINEPYESAAISLFKNLRDRTNQCDFFITTTNPDYVQTEDRININIINPPSLYSFSTLFYYNLKCLSLKHIITYEKENPQLQKYDYVIYIDGDWLMGDSFSEERITGLLDFLEESKYDFGFERPSSLGGGRKEIDTCFFKHKLHDYDVLECDKWDAAEVVNEQFLIFKNNYKFRFFVQRWEQFLWYSVANKINNFSEGFEIGISALEANMKQEHIPFHNFLPDCFAFYNSSGILHRKF